MSTASPIAAPPSQRNCLQLSGIDWKTYSRLLWVLAECPGIRLTYDRGELEIMAPLMMHDDDSDLLGAMVFVLTEELGLPIKRGGSTTLRRRLKQRGIEPDRCYWIANASRMAGVRRLNLRIHPPPDLAIEIDVTHSSMDRLGIYAALKVPEVWRVEGDRLTFLVLGDDGKYVTATHSKAFPPVAPADLIGFLQQARTAGDENAITRQFRAWIRQRLAKP